MGKRGAGLGRNASRLWGGAAQRSDESALLRSRRVWVRTMMLASVGVPLMPAGGSFCNLLKSSMRRLRAGVLMAPTSRALSRFQLKRAG